MRTLQTRLRNLEQATTDKAPFLVFIPDDPPKPEMQAAIDRARRDGRLVIVLRPDDADLAL